MHRSRLYGVLVDTPKDQADQSVAFWSKALGGEAVPEDDEYTAIKGGARGLGFFVQAVDDEPRYHLDIETDDIEAETARLVALGATVVTPPGSWAILRAPGGQLLCVVAIQSPKAEFHAAATTWDD
jgi:predicted enzyme related to lactoylglutathione lyase